MTTAVEAHKPKARDEARDFYRRVLTALREANVPALAGGAYAFTHFTQIKRDTKDFDIFVKREDLERAFAALNAADIRTEFTFPHWLAKAWQGDDFVDIIFSSGNGVARVDDLWFERAAERTIFGVTVKLCPPEEQIWSKSFVMERERYDGADVVHLLHACAETLDWDHLLMRYGPRWRILYVNLVLFGFVYPAERTRIPRAVMETLAARLQQELATNGEEDFQGTLISRAQYLIDLEKHGYDDARVIPRGSMTEEEVAQWTDAIGKIK